MPCLDEWGRIGMNHLNEDSILSKRVFLMRMKNLISNLLRRVFHSKIKMKCVIEISYVIIKRELAVSVCFSPQDNAIFLVHLQAFIVQVLQGFVQMQPYISFKCKHLFLQMDQKIALS